MTLRTKLLLAQLPLAIALVLVSILALLSVSALGQSAPRILRDNYRSVLAAQRMKEAVEGLESTILADLAQGRVTPSERRTELVRWFETELAVEEDNITEVGEGDAATHLRRSWEAYRKHIEGLPARPDLGFAAPFVAGMRPLFSQVKEAAQAILDMNQDAMVRKSDAATVSADRMTRLVALLSIVALLLGQVGSIWLTGRILVPLDGLAQAARRLGEGDLEIRATVAGPDEISELAREFNEMADRVMQYRKSAIGRLVQAQEAAQAAIDSIPYPVFVFGIGRDVISVNDVGRGLLDLKALPPGQSPIDSAEPALRAALEHVLSHVLAGKGAYSPRGFEEAVRVTLRGGDRYLLPRATPMYGEGRGIAGVTVVLQDVTRLRRFDELKNDMVATVAHELRTPLTSLRMAIHLCIEQAAGPLTDRQLDLLHAARQDCERLQTIVDDLLHLSRLQASPDALSRRSVAPAMALRAAVDAQETLARQKMIALEIEPWALLPDVLADPESLQGVLANLMGNALRHTPEGGKVVLRALPVEGFVRFEVADSGPGIAPEFHSKIFERFFRIPGGGSDGAGLGLAIARESILRMRGQIGVQSQPPAGCVFWFTLPLAPEAPATPATPAAAAGPGAEVA